MSAPIVTTFSALQVKTGCHDEKSGNRVQVTGITAFDRRVVRSHDRREVRVLGWQPIGVGEKWIGAMRFGHRRKPSGNGSSGASMCCDVPVIQARPVIVGTMAG